MELGLTGEQLELRDHLRGLLRQICPPAAVRRAWADRESIRGLYRGLAEAGVQTMLVAEADGGLGLGPVEGVVALEELGRVIFPGPVVETGFVAPLLGLRGGVLTGETLVTGGLAGGMALDPDLAEAHLGAPRVDRTAAPTVCGASRLGPAGPAPAAEGAALLGWAAYEVGLGQGMLDTAVAYAKVREQFGRPIGSFQGVQHPLAEVAVKLAYARPLVLRAAVSCHAGHPHALAHAAMARLRASEAADAAGRAALQALGAIGYTTEHDLHLALKRAWVVRTLWGDPHRWRAHVAALVTTSADPAGLWDR